MPGFSFRNRADIEAVLRMLNKHRRNQRLTQIGGTGEPERLGVIENKATTENFIYLTPSDGIPARSGTSAGSAQCTPYYVNQNGQFLELTNDDDASQTHTIYNYSTSAITGNVYVSVDRVFGELVAIDADGGGTADIILFRIVEQSDAEAAESNDCVDKLKDAGATYEANVTWRPCGVTRVAGEADGGTVTLYDPLNSVFYNRENSEMSGREGVAVYMQEDGGYECQWVVTFIDWWREVQMISDVIVTEDEIRFEVKTVKVWDDCDLDDIVIPLIDCEDQS